MRNIATQISVELVPEFLRTPPPEHGTSGVADRHLAAKLEQSASELAAAQQLCDRPPRRRLLVPRSEENVQILLTAYQFLLPAMSSDIPPAAPARRFVENFATVEQQLREICVNLKPDYDDNLPKLANGPLAAYPRIFGIALSLTAHTQSVLAMPLLQRHFLAYQRHSPLRTNELRSVPVMLRLAIVEDLRHIATHIVSDHEARQEAAVVADRLTTVAGITPDQLLDTITEELNTRRTTNTTFVAQLVKRLRSEGPEVWPALDWLKQEAEQNGTSIEEHLELAKQSENATELTILNIVSTLRWLPSFDARQFFESVNLVEGILAKDPSASYPSMEPQSRDSYQRAIISLATKSGFSEPHVAQRAIDLAAQALSTNPDDRRRAHVGYYLIADGRVLLEQSLGYRPRWPERLLRFLRAYPAASYLGSVAVLISILISFYVLYALHAGATLTMLAGLVLLIVVPVSDLVLNALSNSFPLKPVSLPKLDFPYGIPLEARTMVVVPTVLSSEPVVEELIERLEEHYVANQDNNLFFALLSDWSDAAQESMPGDQAVLDAAIEGINRLNARHCDGGRTRFYLFHRQRSWNESEGKWIGWERKRGKLREFNRLLRGAQETNFISNGGCEVDTEFLASVRYVLTLDSDTHLGRDVARRLIGTISHPLNEAQLDPRSRRVVKGYGIIQPRVVVLPPSAERRSIPAVLANRFDVNVATPPISNVYQDFFGEGQYVGKALYSVDVFEAALEGRIPENRLLSHDLLEGMYVRPGFASEIKIYDSAESHYEAATKRQHRWTRGDWQVLPWLLPRVRGENGKSVANALPLIARWQIVDTLRRSLMPVALVFWLLAGWTILPGSPLIWTMLVVLTLGISFSFASATNFLAMVNRTPPSRPIKAIKELAKVCAKQIVATCLQLAISFTFVAHHCYLISDAIVRTLYRRFISHRRLLEWITAAQVKRDSARTPRMFFRYLWSSPVIALACGVLIFFVRRASFPVAAPFLLAWTVAPLVANMLSNRMRTAAARLELEVKSAIRLNGRRMWRALEAFLGLKYDPHSTKSLNQSGYVSQVRSSPINLARLLVWTEATYQLGSIGVVELADRMELTLAEMQKLHQSTNGSRKAHVTRLPGPLAPQFILAAEAGNPAGQLRTLKESCAVIITSPLFDERALKGFTETFSLMKKDLLRLGAAQATGESELLVRLRREIEAGATFNPIPSNNAPLTITGWRKLFDEFAQRALVIEDILAKMSHENNDRRIRELRSWNRSVVEQAHGFSRDLRALHGWTAIDLKVLADILRESTTASAVWKRLLELLERVQPVSQLPEVYNKVLLELEDLPAQLKHSNGNENTRVISALNQVTSAVERSLENSKSFLARWSRLSQACEIAAKLPDLSVLFDEERRISRGY